VCLSAVVVEQSSALQGCGDATVHVGHRMILQMQVAGAK